MIKNLIKEITPLIENVAPVIATSLGGFTKGVPWAIYLLSKAFGVHINDIDTLPQVIHDDPDSDTKIKKLEDNFGDWFLEHAGNMMEGQSISTVTLEFKPQASN